MTSSDEIKDRDHLPRAGSFFTHPQPIQRSLNLTREIRVALAGIGNCSSSLIQGVEYYRTGGTKTFGINYPKVGKYRVGDIRFVAAFDVDKRKVGKDLSEAIFSEPNNTRRIVQVKKSKVEVQMAQPLDGVSPVAGDKVQLSNSKPANLTRVLEEAKADTLVNLTPTGSSKASEMYCEAALRAGCGFINATPAKLASNTKWQARYRKNSLPLIGDDVMDQIGSTILHKSVLTTLVERGTHVSETYQLDIGGGTESEITLDKKRYEIKRAIKSEAVAAAVPYKFPIVAGSSDFVDFMENRRTSYFWIRGEYFAGTEFTLDMRLSVEDGPACAGVLIDIIRMSRIARDKKVGGPLIGVSAYGFKAPPKTLQPQEMKKELESFIKP